jgi:hypothetical protein
MPPPWTSWLFIALIGYRRRKIRAYATLRSRLAPLLGRRSGGPVALEDARGRHPMPGLPAWECLLDDMDTLVVNRVTGEEIHLDLVHGPEVFSSCQLPDHFRSRRNPGTAARRLLELHPSCRALRLPLEKLLAAGLIHEVDAFDFQICTALRWLEEPIADFLEAWDDPGRRPWLAASIGDWPAAHAAAMAGGDPDLICLTGDRARRCRELWLGSIRTRIAEEGLDDEILHALADAEAGDLPEYVRQALDQKHMISFTAMQLIRDDPSYLPDVARLYSRVSGDPPDDLLAGPCAGYLARHGHRVREMLEWLGSPHGRQAGRAALLAVEHLPEMSLPLLRRALRSTASHDRLTGAAVLALVDRPWSHRELLAVLDESDDADATAECRAALRESRVPEVRRTAGNWEARYPVQQDDPWPSARGLDRLGGSDLELARRMDRLRDRIDIERLRELSPALRDG